MLSALLGWPWIRQHSKVFTAQALLMNVEEEWEFCSVLQGPSALLPYDTIA